MIAIFILALVDHRLFGFCNGKRLFHIQTFDCIHNGNFDKEPKSHAGFITGNYLLLEIIALKPVSVDKCHGKGNCEPDSREVVEESAAFCTKLVVNIFPIRLQQFKPGKNKKSLQLTEGIS
jgi:hypothetical protein